MKFRRMRLYPYAYDHLIKHLIRLFFYAVELLQTLLMFIYLYTAHTTKSNLTITLTLKMFSISNVIERVRTYLHYGYPGY